MNTKKKTVWDEEDYIKWVSRAGLTIVTLQLEHSKKTLRKAIANVRNTRGTDGHEEALERFRAHVFMQRIYKKVVEKLSA